MHAPLTNLQPLNGSYDLRLVALSLVVACLAAYASLTLAERVMVARGRRRWLWLLGGAAAMGSGIWSMHFTGMLAFSLPVPVGYDVVLVGVSLVVAIAASGIALVTVTRLELTIRAWLAGGLILGAGIGAMHYVGMAAMQMDAMARWNSTAVVLSMVIAVATSLVALWLLFRLRAVTRVRDQWRRPTAALVMGIAIAGMHYTGMAGATFRYMVMSPSTPHVVSADAMGGGAIALMTVVLLGLLLGVAFIDRRFTTQEQALAESKQHFRMVVANAPVILFALDASGIVTLGQGRGLAALGHAPDAVLGRPFFDLFAEVPELVSQARRALGGQEHTALSMVRDVVLETRWTPVRDDHDHFTGVIAVATDITERHRVASALEHQAMHDALTGLPNRAMLRERLLQEVTTANTVHGAVALLFMDLNRFKEVNDTLGHQVGDELLIEVGRRVQTLLQPADLVARLGGDEFALVLAADEATARAGALRMLAKLGEPIIVEGHALQIGASLGIAVYPDHGSDVLTLMRHADVAMYVAKRAGGGVSVYDPAEDLHNPERFTMEHDLHQAISAGDLQLAFQPKVSLDTSEVCGVEALVRWLHPVLGQVPPDRFIPLAEQTGLITPLTQWVLQAALQQLQTWEQEGLVLSVAVNLSTLTLQDASLPDTVAWLLDRFQIAPKRLLLEVTESALMADPAKAIAVIERLAALGTALSIDDFGMGYSSLSYLMDLPVTEIKIDKSFVLGIATNTKNPAVVRAVSELGRNLGVRVVAEGVETSDAWQTVRALGCAVAQGHYISRPLPPAKMAPWLVDWERGAASGVA